MFRFTIRDVLWLTVVVAVVAKWQVESRQNEKRLEQARAAWRSERDKMLAERLNERNEWQALLDRIRVIHKLPKSTRQELEDEIVREARDHPRP